MDTRAPVRCRNLTDKSEMFKHNAWDDVEWDEDQEVEARKKVEKNSEITFSSEEVSVFEKDAAEYWSKFYSIHNNRFFKNRNWLLTEFFELAPPDSVKESISKNEIPLEDTDDVTVYRELNSDSEEILINLRKNESYIGENSSFKVLEVGCGVGNTVFPLLEMNNDPNLFVYCCDFSKTAVDIVQESEKYDTRRCNAFVCDLTEKTYKTPFPQGTLDIIVCIFVFSAINPELMQESINNLVEYLKPGGLILFRDYGLYDMAQLRFKKGKCLAKNFYVRGDGTRCYFFEQGKLKELMENAGLYEVENEIDRRLQVNRGKQLAMYRVWIQAKYKKK